MLATSICFFLKFRSDKKKTGTQPKINANMILENWLVILETKYSKLNKNKISKSKIQESNKKIVCTKNEVFH